MTNTAETRKNLPGLRRELSKAATEWKDAAEKFAKNDHRIEDGVLLWNSNDRSPMDDLTSLWLELDLIDMAVFRATSKAREAQNSAFIAEYRKARTNRTPEQIAEEQFEMRAAFGPGETVVNVITGERTTL